VAVVIGNIPMIYPLFRRCMQRMGAGWLFTHNSSSARSGGGGGWSAMGRGDRRAKANKFAHPLSRSTLTGTATGSDSAEHIVLQDHLHHTTAKDGITLTTETAVTTSNASLRGRDEEVGYPQSLYGPSKLAGPGYTFHVSSKSQGDNQPGFAS